MRVGLLGVALWRGMVAPAHVRRRRLRLVAIAVVAAMVASLLIGAMSALL